MQYTKGYRFRSLVGVLFKLIEAIFELILPLIMVQVLNEAVTGRDINVIMRLVAVMVVMTLLGYASSIMCQYNAAIVSQGIGGRLREALMKKISTFGLYEIDVYGSSSLTNRITVDVTQVQVMVAMAIRLAVRAPILMGGSLIAIYSINAQLARTLLLSFPLFIVIVSGFMWLTTRYYKKMQQSLDALIQKTRESLSGIRIIRAFSKTEYEKEQILKRNMTLDKQTKKFGLGNAMSSPVTMLTMNLVMLVLIYQGAINVQLGSMSQAQTVAIINYCTQLVLTLVVFMNLVITFSKGISSIYRIKEILDVKPQVQNSAHPITALPDSFTIRFDRVSFSYPHEQRKVLSDFSLEINAQETVGFIGLTGSGKSTIMALLLRYYDVTEGAIYFNDINIKDIDLQTLRKNIGYATQTSELLSGTLAENIAMNREVDVEEALNHAQGGEIVQKGFSSFINAKGTNLSGGQRQRINIARALAGKPPMIILDDSLSALDYLTDRKLREQLNHYYQDATKLIISQRTTSLMSAHKIVVLHQGRASAIGTHEELLKISDLYRQIHETQVKGV